MTRKPPRLDLNPSAADRWTTCTASPRFILDNHDRLPFSTDTPYNLEGKAAHEVAAAYLQNREPGETPVPIDGDMRWHGWNYAEYVNSLREKGSTLLVEQKLPLWYMPGRNAIVDAAVINTAALHVIDYKYGEGVVVHPEGSLQATIYAQTIGTTMVPFPADDFPVFVHIYQPRGRNSEDQPHHVWQTTWGEIAELAAEIHSKATQIQMVGGEVQFTPSEKACRWCPAKGFCTARQASLADGFEVLDALTPLPPPAQNTISEVQLVRILKHKAAMISWLDDVEEWATDFVRSGGHVPGFKLVMSRGGNRYWKDPQKVVELLLSSTVLKRSEIVEEKVAGPGAVEKLIGKNKFPAEVMALIAQNPGSPVLAPESDKREAIGSTVSDFEVLPERENTETPNQ